MHTKIFIILGGNQGDKIALLNQACGLIVERIGRILKKSLIYETPPWGFDSKDSFFNQVLEIESELSAFDLMDELLRIETKLGRVRNSDEYASRTMDIDILFFGTQIIEEKDLQIPHPRLHLRKFVLEPMAEIAPEFIHPIIQKNIQTLLLDCVDDSFCKIVLSY